MARLPVAGEGDFSVIMVLLNTLCEFSFMSGPWIDHVRILALPGGSDTKKQKSENNLSNFRSAGDYIGRGMAHDAELLEKYVRHGSNEAFRALVAQHIDMVYAAALRRSHGDVHLAQDVTQEVFARLSRSPKSVSDASRLAGWLHSTACHVAINIMRAESRRRTHEVESNGMIETTPQSDPMDGAGRIRQVLDGALGRLGALDRQVIITRFFQRQSVADVASQFGITRAAAHKRLERSLVRLRDVFRRQGIQSTEAALAAVLAQEGAVAAPAGLAIAVSDFALGGASVATGGSALAAAAPWISAALLSAGLWIATVAVHRDVVAMTSRIDELRSSWRSSRTAPADQPAVRSKVDGAAVAFGTAVPREQGRSPNDDLAAWFKEKNQERVTQNEYGLVLGSMSLAPDTLMKIKSMLTSLALSQMGADATALRPGSSTSSLSVETPSQGAGRDYASEIAAAFGTDGEAALKYVLRLGPASLEVQSKISPMMDFDGVALSQKQEVALAGLITGLRESSGNTGLDFGALILQAQAFLSPRQINILRTRQLELADSRH